MKRLDRILTDAILYGLVFTGLATLIRIALDLLEAWYAS